MGYGLGRIICAMRGHKRMRKVTKLRVISVPDGQGIFTDYICPRCGFTEKRRVYPRKVKAAA